MTLLFLFLLLLQGWRRKRQIRVKTVDFVNLTKEILILNTHKKNMYYLTDLTSKFSENSLKSQQFIFLKEKSKNFES